MGDNGLPEGPEGYTDETPYFWGWRFLSFEEARQHFLVVGSTGSGKTLTIRLLMQSVFSRMKDRKSSIRGLVYDAKKDMVSVLQGIGLEMDNDIRLLNPLDARCWAWDVCKDVQNVLEVDDLAYALIPAPESESQPYFRDTARVLVCGVIEGLIERGIPWTLRQVILICEDGELLEKFLKQNPHTIALGEHFENEKTIADVRSTLNTCLRKYRAIAACWDYAQGEGRAFSIRDWVDGRFVLVLGNDDVARSGIDRLNQLIFNFAAKHVLSKPGIEQESETWMFLDELREAGKLEALRNVLLRGRSKGCSVVMGFQSISGMEKEYGKEEAQELVGCAKNMAILHINNTDPYTQEWASNILGDREYFDRKVGTATNSNSTSSAQGGSSSAGRSRNISYDRVKDRVMLPKEFSTQLPKASRENGLKALYYTEGTGFYMKGIGFRWLFSGTGLGEQVGDDYLPTPSQAMRLRELSSTEKRDLLEPDNESESNGTLQDVGRACPP